ncbi:hypothetical protein [Mycolicibacterium frederiksbergense]|uniref:hypothetical protein n=1 Tax=Mycolicibacterium frederiksbergense TaxID=117567 RepID=UPI00399A5C8B
MAPPGPAPALAPGAVAVAPPGPASAPGAGADDDGASVVVAAPVEGVVVIVDSVVEVSVEVPLSELQAVSPPASTAPATAAARGRRRTI